MKHINLAFWVVGVVTMVLGVLGALGIGEFQMTYGPHKTVCHVERVLSTIPQSPSKGETS